LIGRRRPVAAWILAAALIAAGVAGVAPASAQTQTVGLFVSDERASDGLTLFGPKEGTSVHLLNREGLAVHTWETGVVARSMNYLLPNGNLLRAVNRGVGIKVRLREIDWEGDIVWEFTLDDSEFGQHHDIEPLPNGNVLFIGRETKSAAEAIAAGRDPLRITAGVVRPEVLIEIRPIPPDGGEIVWEWHTWDHLVQDFDITKENYGVVADHPELVDLNYGPTDGDWTHFNGIDYDPEFDQVIITSRTFSEFWIVDHSTTTEEAAGHTGGNSGRGGDLLYRWGNPAAYGRGTSFDQILFGQHDARRIPPARPGGGNILVFDNGWGRPGTILYSTVDEIVPPVDEFGAYTIEPGLPFEPDQPVWSYVSDPPGDFYSALISGSDRRPEGNTVICEGASGHLFEVTSGGGEIVWDYVNPIGGSGPVAQGDPVPDDNRVFKVRHYSRDDPAFVGKDLTGGEPLELFDPPWPVPPGSLTASRLADPGDPIQVDWDASTCTSHDYHLLFGPLANVSAYELSGAECNLGTSGSHVWTDPPSESLYFLVVGTDDTGVYESDWGPAGSGGRRHGNRASFRCGTTTRIVSSACP